MKKIATGGREELRGCAGGWKRRAVATPSENPSSVPEGVSRISVRVGDRIRFINTSEIAWIEASGNYSVIHTLAGEKHMLRETLLSLENQLSAQKFFRLGRSALVNLEQIAEAQPAFDGEYVVVLKTGAKLPMTRGLPVLQERLKFL